MITLETSDWQIHSRHAEFHGLSTDTKPTTVCGAPIENGSKFYEIDTTYEYKFDQEHLQWIKQ